MLFDLSEAFSWVRYNDLRYQPLTEFGHPDGCHIVLGDNLKKHFNFLALREGLYFKLAEVIVKEIDPADASTVLETRHTSLTCTDLKIPSNIPKNNNFIGPINEINLLRILHLAQTHLNGNREMQDQIIHDLNLSFPDDDKKETAPYRAGSNVVSLFAAGPARK